MKTSYANLIVPPPSSKMRGGPRVRQQLPIPLKGGEGTLFTFRGLRDVGEHLAIGLGKFKRDNPLVRIHSECLTGDVFGSARCDCGAQLEEAITKIRKNGGFLIYLRQEGRGIGLYNKLDAYALQNTGLDTYEANRALGFADDLREYDVAAEILRALGVTKIELLSNNPDKVQQIEKNGIEVSRFVRTGVFVSEKNKSYLEAKIRITGHKINI